MGSSTCIHSAPKSLSELKICLYTGNNLLNKLNLSYFLEVDLPKTEAEIPKTISVAIH